MLKSYMIHAKISIHKTFVGQTLQSSSLNELYFEKQITPEKCIEIIVRCTLCYQPKKRISTSIPSLVSWSVLTILQLIWFWYVISSESDADTPMYVKPVNN